MRLSHSDKGQVGVITGFDTDTYGDDPAEVAQLLRRIVELGLCAGTRVEIRHYGPIGRDPIAVFARGALLGIGRREAVRIFVREEPR